MPRKVRYEDLLKRALEGLEAKYGRQKSRACRVDTTPIPCDAKVHERTFGPAVPFWHQDDAPWADRLANPGWDGYPRHFIEIGHEGAPKVVGGGTWPPEGQDDRLRHLMPSRARGMGKAVDKQGLPIRWTPEEQRQRVIRHAIREDRPLSIEIAAWRKQIECNRKQWKLCLGPIDVTEVPANEVGKTEVGSDVSMYATMRTAIQGYWLIGTCVKQRFMCVPYRFFATWAGGGDVGAAGASERSGRSSETGFDHAGAAVWGGATGLQSVRVPSVESALGGGRPRTHPLHEIEEDVFGSWKALLSERAFPGWPSASVATETADGPAAQAE